MDKQEGLNADNILQNVSEALKEGQFIPYYQPQYNHATGMLVGAEALARWKHPEYGLVPPNIFIPVLEQNDFIFDLDLHIFSCVCEFMRRCLDDGLTVVPLCTNITRYDMFKEDFVERLEAIRAKYDVPSKYLRLEITESAAMGSINEVNAIIKKLHDFGYIVEMDDFGSGYSSLNVLKDIDIDIIKLDMEFLRGNLKTGSRGGTILSSVVRMAKWLNIPVIAEGVETAEQANFLRSIGCDHIQGFFYSRPLPEAQYRTLLENSTIGRQMTGLQLIEKLNAADFWNPDSLDTLVFSNFVGGAAVFCYRDGGIEMLRVNEKYLRELGMNMTEEDIIKNDAWHGFDENNKAVFISTIKRAIESKNEESCETVRHLCSDSCGDDTIYIRSEMRLIGQTEHEFLFYEMIRNITAEKKQNLLLQHYENDFKNVVEQVNIYYWEYTVATKEMRPCFRCMRDLNLPPVVRNYPEPAIEAGIFPPDYADMYRDWHRQIAAGVPELEAIIPLTVGRVPFRVRYTTEFDEHGRPIKAHGSATFIVDEKK